MDEPTNRDGVDEAVKPDPFLLSLFAEVEDGLRREEEAQARRTAPQPPAPAEARRQPSPVPRRPETPRYNFD